MHLILDILNLIKKTCYLINNTRYLIKKTCYRINNMYYPIKKTCYRINKTVNPVMHIPYPTSNLSGNVFPARYFTQHINNRKRANQHHIGKQRQRQQWMRERPVNAVIKQYADNQNVHQINAVTVITDSTVYAGNILVFDTYIFHPHKNGNGLYKGIYR